MEHETIINSKEIKPVEKTEAISNYLLENKISVNELINYARELKDPLKATCIEAIELATKKNPAVSTPECLRFVSNSLTSSAPRVKWESARVIGNIAHLFPENLDTAVSNLLVNTEHSGTVVRWSAAFALGEIIKLKLSLNKELIKAAEAICLREEKNSIRKIYLAATKKALS
jgi:hypothetical protein